MAMELDLSIKLVELERQTTASNPNGTFGFSVLGGAGTKFPAVVCEIDTGGPADRCGKISVGDTLTILNGEQLNDLTPNELVQRIRGAPSPSQFELKEDDDVRDRVLALLDKQLQRAKLKQQRAAASQQQAQPTKKGNVTSPSEKDKGKRPAAAKKKVIEVEPPVNRAGGDHIVKMVDNRIVGQVEAGSSEEGRKREEGSRRRSPHRSPRPNRARDSPRPEGDSIPEENGTSSPSSSSGHSPRSLERKPRLLTPLQAPPTKSASMDNFITSTGTTSETDKELINGVNSHSFSGSSGLNFTPKSGSLSSFDEKERENEGRARGEREVEQGNSASSELVHTPVDGNRERHEGVVMNERPVSRGEAEGNSLTEWIDPDEKEQPLQHNDVVPTRSNSRKQADRASQAITLARKLYMLDGFKKSEVAERLSQPTEFGQAVAREYLTFFDFTGLELNDALRQFLAFFSLTGESQERERVMQHFSERYYQCNPHALPSSDAVHGLGVALLLLNTDLHSDHGGRKMSLAQFNDNLGQIGVDLPKGTLKAAYDDIKRSPLQWAVDDDQSSPDDTKAEDDVEERVYHVTIPGTFVQAVLPGSAPVFKEGFVMKKNIMEAPHKKVPRGKRQWKAYYAYLKGFLLYFAPPQGQGDLHLDDTSSAITVTHCLAMRAHDYHKKSSVVRITTADWHVFLLQATDVTDMQQWIGAINKAAALYSSPPLAAPIGSKAGFHRPTFPLAPTRNNQDQQIESHEAKVKSLEKEAKEHQSKKPSGKNAKHGFLEEWFDQYEFLQFETNRFRIYLASLCSDAVVDFNAPLPSGLIPSPSVSTLHNPDHASGETDFLEEFHRHGHMSHIMGTPPVSRGGGALRELQRHSPVLSRKPNFK